MEGHRRLWPPAPVPKPSLGICTGWLPQSAPAIDYWLRLLVQLTVASLLFAAGLLKLDEVADRLHDTLLGPDSVWPRYALGQLEIFLGIWIISGTRYSLACKTVSLTFFAFATASAYNLVAGNHFCACFGRIPLSPGRSLLLDLAVLAGLLPSWRPQASVPQDGRIRTALLHLCSLALVLATALSSTVGSAWASFDSRPRVLSPPDQWVGGPLPVMDSIDIERPLRHGDWVLFFYHPDCPKCQHAQEMAEHLAVSPQGRSQPPRVALLDVRPDSGQSMAVRSAVILGRLAPDCPTEIATPLIVRLIDGDVVGVSTTLDESTWPDLRLTNQ
jgi:hypothetical protein